MCKDPRLADGRENEQLAVKNDSLPLSMIPLLDNPNEECNASDFATHSPKRAAHGSEHHYANVPVDGEIDVGCEN